MSIVVDLSSKLSIVVDLSAVEGEVLEPFERLYIDHIDGDTYLAYTDGFSDTVAFESENNNPWLLTGMAIEVLGLCDV